MSIKRLPHSGIRIVVGQAAPVNSDITKADCTFLGGICSQAFRALFYWERVFWGRPVRRFIEIGTGLGNMSLYFYLQCLNKNADFVSYDIFNKFKRNDSSVKKRLELASHIRIKDVFNHVDEVAGEIQKPGITILFCDGMDKPHEVRTFAPFLKQGDIMAVHDWPRAIRLEWINDTLREHRIVPMWTPGEWDTMITAFFRRS